MADGYLYKAESFLLSAFLIQPIYNLESNKGILLIVCLNFWICERQFRAHGSGILNNNN